MSEKEAVTHCLHNRDVTLSPLLNVNNQQKQKTKGTGL